MTEEHQPGQRYGRGGRIAVVALTATFIAFEILKESILPDLSKWASHSLSIAFVAALSAVSVFLVTRMLRIRARDSVRVQEEAAARHASEERLRRLVEGTQVIPWEADARSWRFTYVGPQAVRMLGYPIGDWYGEAFWEAHIHPDDRQSAMDFCRESSKRGEHFDFDYRMLSSTGEVVWLHDLVSVSFEAGEPALLQGFMVDITARKRAEEELAESLRFEQMVSELSASLVALPGGRFDRGLHAALRRVGEFMAVDSCAFVQVSPDRARRRITSMWSAPGAELEPGLFDVPVDKWHWFASRLASGDAVVFSSLAEMPDSAAAEREHAQLTGVRSGLVVPLSLGADLIGYLGIRTIHAERSWSEEDVQRARLVGEVLANALVRRQSLEALEGLSQRLIQALESERRRIALELHDDVSQQLALLAVELELLDSRPSELSKRLAELASRVKELSSTVDAIPHRLHPGKVEQLGLAAALERLCQELAEGHEIQVKLDCQGLPTQIPEEVSLCVYRIVQEGLQNVVKHSRAGEARVDVVGDSREIRLRIEDAGVGFDPYSPEALGGIGLTGMRERLRLVGGELSIQSRPSLGTRIEARAPVSPDGAS